MVVEKPFGTSLESARAINAKLRSVFDEGEIYRIDHYLGKETVQNILVLRFANEIFESLWNRDHIDSVEISVSESLGVENRGAYYEKSGALRDMVQNHLLNLAALWRWSARRLSGRSPYATKLRRFSNACARWTPGR